MTRALGLDFGTTNTVLATCPDPSATARPLAFAMAHERIEAVRSALCFWNAGDADRRALGIEVGPWAIQHYIDNPGDCRFLQSLKTFAASPHFQGTYVYGVRFRFEDLLEAFFDRVRVRAQSDLQPLPQRLVVGRPVAFAGAAPDSALALARYRTALSRFGFKEIIFVFEPVAAAFFFARSLRRSATVLVADFGGGTTDYSIMRFEVAAGTMRAEPLGHGGIGIAGDTFDYRIISRVILPHLGKGSAYRSLGKVLDLPESIFANFGRWNMLSVLKASDEFRDLKRIVGACLEPEKVQRFITIVDNDLGYPLYRAVSAAKARLSSAAETPFEFPVLGHDSGTTIRRTDFEAWIADDLERIEASLDDTLARASLGDAAIDKVFLTGGTSFVPAVRDLFERRFGHGRIESGDELLSIASGLALIGEREDAEAWAAA